ncbi:MAG: dolichyl-phosphate-mannose--protein mannosyltransferase, partial [Brachybacterium sp.]
MHTEEVATDRADVENEPESLLATYRQRLKTFDLPFSRIAWAGAMAVFGLALVLRLWGLGVVDELIFDETYYVKDGYALTQ